MLATPPTDLTICRPCTTPVRLFGTSRKERAWANRDSASPCRRHVRSEAAPVALRSALLRTGARYEGGAFAVGSTQ